jgi:xylulokinase
MALGAGCVADGMAYTSLGSSAWIAVSGHEPIVDVRYKPYVFTHCIPGMFVSSAAIFSAGSSFRWLRDTVCRDLLGEKEPYDAMTRLAAQSPLGANRLIFNPSLAGGSSLDKSPQIKGGWIGLQLGHTQSDLIRAVMEGICLNLRIALDVMAGYTALSEDMLLVGGGGRSQFWRSLFADTYNKNILETNVGQDAGSLGAAAVAAVGVGLWKDFNLVPRLHVTKSRVEPVKENSARYSTILRLFKRIAEVQAEIGEMIEQTEWE